MKKFRFKLGSVLTIRRFKKNQAAAALSEAQLLRNRLNQHLNEELLRQEDLEQALVTCYKGTTTAAEINRLQTGLQFQRSQVEEVRNNLHEALEQENERRQEVLLARQGEETILNLLEKEKERYRRELDSEDEIAVNEFVNASHHLKQAT